MTQKAEMKCRFQYPKLGLNEGARTIHQCFDLKSYIMVTELYKANESIVMVNILK